jgi:hypothetical protein
MLQYELLDETLDINKTQFYHLSIQVQPDGFLFAILDPGEAKYMGLKRYSYEKTPDPERLYEHIRDILQKDPFLQQSYREVSLIHSESRSTLLPAALFEQDRLKLYFEFNHRLGDLDELHYNYLKPADAYIVFPVYSEIASLYSKKWVNTRFFHQATPLIDRLLTGEDKTGKYAGINFNEDHFDICVIEQGQLKYHNNFRFRNEEDLLYFVLFVFDKLELSQEETPVQLSGEIDKFSERPQRLKRYIRKLSFPQAPPGFRYPASFHKVQEHSLLNLLRIYRCG